MAVRLRWDSYTDGDVATVRIYRRLAGSTAPLTIIATVSGSPPALTYLDTTAVNGTSYAYRIDYVDDASNVSPQSDKVTFTPGGGPADTQAPTWPVGAALESPGQDATDIFLQWDNAVDNVGVDYYEIFRRPGAGGTYVLMGLVDYPTQTWAQGGLTPNTSYQFKIEALDAAGNRSAALSLTVSTDSTADTTPPPDVTGLRVVAMTPTTAQLDWDDSFASDLAHYHLEKNSVSAGNVTSSNATLTGLTANTGYIVSVKAVDTSNNGANPVAVSFTTPAVTPSGNVFKFIDEYPESIAPSIGGKCPLDPSLGVNAPDYSNKIITFVRAHSGTPGNPNTLIFPSWADMPSGFTGFQPTFHCEHIVQIGGLNSTSHVHDVIIDGGNWQTLGDDNQASTTTGSVLRAYTSGKNVVKTNTDNAYASACWPRLRAHFVFGHCHDVVFKHWSVYGPNVAGNRETGNTTSRFDPGKKCWWANGTEHQGGYVGVCNALTNCQTGATYSGTQNRVGGGKTNVGGSTSPYVAELEEQHGFAFLGDAWNVTVSDVEAHHMFGDGATFYENHGAGTGRQTVFKRFNVHHTGRMGISVTGCQNVTLKDGYVWQIPRGGVDLEPPGANVIRNVEINNVTFRDVLLLPIPAGGGRGPVLPDGRPGMDDIRIINNTCWGDKQFSFDAFYDRDGANFGSNVDRWKYPRGRIAIIGNKSPMRCNDGAYNVRLHNYWGVIVRDNWFPSNYSGGDQNDYNNRRTDSIYLTACMVYAPVNPANLAAGYTYEQPINGSGNPKVNAINDKFGGGGPTDNVGVNGIQRGTGPVNGGVTNGHRGSIGARFPDQVYSGAGTGCFGPQSGLTYFENNRDGVRNFLPCAEHLMEGERDPPGPGGRTWPPNLVAPIYMPPNA